jgi:Listeria-Bacteroides repeat domain (List_Bact_rpt).
VTIPSNPVKSGYTFVEWQLNGDAYDFSTPVTSDLDLIAVYKADAYTVHFNSDGGTPIPSQTVNDNDFVTQPANPAKSGYTFVEWRLNGAAYNFNTPVTSDLNLIAVYKANNTNVGHPHLNIHAIVSSIIKNVFNSFSFWK